METDILSFTASFGERSQTWLYRQVALLGKHKVHVLTYRRLNPEEYPHRPVTIMPAAGPWLSRALRLPLYVAERKKPLLDLRQRAVIRRIADKEDVKLVQSHFSYMGHKMLEMTDKLGLPHVVWIYGSDAFRENREFLSMLDELIRSPALFCVTSKALKMKLESLGCSEDRASVFNPGVELPPAAPKQKPASEELGVISVGRLVDFKDPVGMVKVAALLDDRKLKFKWRHYGDGELRPEVEREIKERGLENRFRLAGSVSNEAVLDAMRNADVMVHNAIVAPDGGRESFGVALVEASALGLPIVAVRVGGIPEIVRDNHTGYLMEMGDLEGVAGKVEVLASQPELREEMGRRAVSFAAENFESGKQIEKLDNFYSDLINRNHAGGG